MNSKCNNIIKIGKKKLKFNEEIITAGYFKGWAVVCTKTKIYAYGSVDIVLNRLISKAKVKDEGLYFSTIGNNFIYLLSHPLEPEVFLFSASFYSLKDVVSKILILEKNTTYLLKDTAGITETKKLFYNEDLFDSIESLKPTLFYIKESKDGLKSCIINETEVINAESIGVKPTFILEYDNFLVCALKNKVLMVRLDRNTSYGVKRSKIPFETTITLNEDIKQLIKYRMKIKKNAYIDFLRLNNVLFLGSEIICNSIDWSIWKETTNQYYAGHVYFKPFWNGLNSIEKKILGCYTKVAQRDFMEMYLKHKEKRFGTIRLYKDVWKNANKILEESIYKYKSIWDYYSSIKSVENINAFTMVTCCEKLLKFMYIQNNLQNDVLDITYKRIAHCFLASIKFVKYKSINNLAYKIIYLELNKEKIAQKSNAITSVSKLKKIGMKKFGDPRLDEIFALFDEKPRIFEINEADLENKGEKTYLMRISCNIGRAYFGLHSGIVKDKYSVAPLKFPIYKNGELCEIETKEQGQSDWASFNYSIFRAITLRENNVISYNFIESKIKQFENMKKTTEHSLAGMIMGFGLIQRFDTRSQQNFFELVDPNKPIISLSLLAGVGMSNRGKCEDDLGLALIYYLRTSLPIQIHVGALIGLGFLYAESGNVLASNVIVEHINKKGIFKNEVYNKGNKVYYDYFYNITASICLSLLYCGTSMIIFKFINLDNTFCELLANGLILFGSKESKFKSKLLRFDGDRLEELFYSEFFVLGLTLSADKLLIANEIFNELENATVYDLYRYAGRIFYLGVASIMTTEKLSKNLISQLMKICLESEKLMVEKEEYKVIFDFSLIALSIILNSTFDLNVLRILRRRIKMSERGKFLVKQKKVIFTTTRCKQESQYSITYGDIEKYKMCLGILTCGLGSMSIVKTHHLVIDIVSTFFINFPISPIDQEYFNVFRFFLIFSMKINNNGLKNTTKYFKLANRKSKNIKKKDASNINTMLKIEYATMSIPDRKFVLDVLTEFYEKHGDKDILLNINILKKLVCKSN